MHHNARSKWKGIMFLLTIASIYIIYIKTNQKLSLSFWEASSKGLVVVNVLKAADVYVI